MSEFIFHFKTDEPVLNIYRCINLENIHYINEEGIKCIEQWLPAIGYEGLYEVSDLGRIKRLRRGWNNSLGNTHTFKEGIVVQTKNQFGYVYCELAKKDRSRKKTFAHVIVAKAWIKNPYNKLTVNHKKGKKTDNRVSQLEWATRSENQLHGYRMGLLKVNKTALGKKWGLSPHSIPIDQFNIDNTYVRTWSSQREAADTLKLSQGNICSAINGKYKSTGGFKWKYSNNPTDITKLPNS